MDRELPRPRQPATQSARTATFRYQHHHVRQAATLVRLHLDFNYIVDFDCRARSTVPSSSSATAKSHLCLMTNTKADPQQDQYAPRSSTWSDTNDMGRTSRSWTPMCSDFFQSSSHSVRWPRYSPLTSDDRLRLRPQRCWRRASGCSSIRRIRNERPHRRRPERSTERHHERCPRHLQQGNSGDFARLASAGSQASI